MIPRGAPRALAVAVIAHGALLTFVAVDRLGDRGATLALTEREAPLGGSGAVPRLELAFDLRPALLEGDATWFGAAKLAALGFDCSLDPGAPDAATHYDRLLPRRAWVVLEQEGEAWQEWLARGEMQQRLLGERVALGEMTQAEYDEAGSRLDRERRTRSRLFVIDVDADASELRRRWPDAGRQVVVPAVIRPRVHVGPSGPHLSGAVVRLLPGGLALSADQARRLQSLVASGTDPGGGLAQAREPRYRALLQYGRLGLPRVREILPP